MTADKAPDAFRTISEAAEDLGLEQHVLRFWETRFPQIKPLKRGGGRRYYRPDDVDFLRGLKHLLHDQRYTIKGVQKIIKDQGAKAVAAIGRGQTLTPPPAANEAPPAATSAAVRAPVAEGSRRDQLEAALAELLEARKVLTAA
jgi:DNA-binding transcriptional MerR regulator